MSIGVENDRVQVLSEPKCLDKVAFFDALNYQPHEGQLEIHRSTAPRRIVACGVRWGKCVAGSGEVYDLASGRRRSVAELGTLTTLSWDEELRARESEAIAFESGTKECVRVRLASGQEVDLSTDHPVRAATGWKAAARLEPRELVATPRWLPPPASPMQCADESLVLLAGLLMDGGTSSTGVTYTKMPGDMLDLFAQAVSAFGGWMRRLEPRTSKAHDFYVGGISRQVNEWGLRGCTAKTKRLPAEFYGLDTEQVGRLLGLLFAGDGWFDNNRVAMTLANRLLLEDVRHLLLRIGVHGRVSRTNKRFRGRLFDAWTLRITGSANIGQFLNHVTEIPGRDEVMAPLREHASLAFRSDTDLVPVGRSEVAAIGSEAGIPARRVRDGHLHVAAGAFVTRAKFARACSEMEYSGSLSHLADSDVLWSRVLTVDPIGERRVYDISVPGDKNFACCNVIVHNTLCAAMEGLCAAMQPKDRSIGWVVAPTYDLADKVFRELVVLVAEHLRHRIIALKESERRLILRNMAGGESEIRGKSADNPVSLLGEGLDWLIADEASRLKPTIWESHLSQRLLDKRGWALLISTPKGKGWYYDLFRRGQGNDPDYASWNNPSWTNPHVSAELIEQERERLPERVFKQEYGGEFLEGSGAVFRYVRDAATGDFHEPVDGMYYYAGLDLAKVEDYTVLVIMDKDGKVVFVDRFHRLDWSVQVNRITAATSRYDALTLVDSTGAGEPIYESLRKAGCRVRPYPFTARSKGALIDNLSLMLEQRKITLPRSDLWPEGIDELESFEFSVTDSGHVRTGAPTGIHDDCVISLALASWLLRTRLGMRASSIVMF